MSKEGNNPSFFERFAPFLILISICLAFFAGTLWQKVRNLEKGTTPTATTAPQETLSSENLKKYAKDLNLKTKDFNNCLDKAKYEQKVKDELKEGENLGVTGTPAFFINGMLLGGAYPYDAFKAVLDFELKGGNWKKPDANVKYLVDGNEDNGEIVTERKKVEIADAPKKGEENALVTIIEFSDFQCPYCARFHSQTLPQIEENYIKTGKVLFAYKQFPLTFHQYAQKAAEAALCANEQGKFWEYHNKLFEEVSKTL